MVATRNSASASIRSREEIMNRKIMLVAASALFVTGAFAADSPKNASGIDHWTAAQLKGYEKSLHAAVSGPSKSANSRLTAYESSSTLIAHREANGNVEVHSILDDYFVVQSGVATLVYGGEVVNPKLAEPNETRGDSIKGGAQLKLAVDDIVHIPATVPHQLLVEPDKQFTYFVIKVKAGAAAPGR
jgi:mannose-6-phosphate isomerase-like protein (cupin superfamily)